jgi:DNA polymerase IV
VARRLRVHRTFAHTVGLKIRFAPFRTLTRDATLEEPTSFDSVIFESVLRLFNAVWTPGRMVRLVGVRASNLERGAFQRILAEGHAKQKMSQLLQAADKIRDRFGFDILKLGRSLDPIDEGSDGLDQFDFKLKARQPKRKPKREFLGRAD